MGKIALLTGAGFSNDFGGYLAKDMWERIFRHPEVRKCANLVDILSTDFNYESIYFKVHSDSQYCDNERKALDTAIFDVYMSLDDQIRQANRSDGQKLIYPINNKMVDRLLDGGGYFFTLNQDLFVERWFSSSNTSLHHPYMANKEWHKGDKAFDESYYVTAPKEPLNHPESLKVLKWHYIKLHGSFNWKSSDGSDMMVIGQDKESLIAQEPLLVEYFQIFKNELYQEGMKLLVIGYSFADNHINEVIAESMKNYKLKLVVVAPWGPVEFMRILRDLLGDKSGRLCELYYPIGKKISELFLPNDNEWQEVMAILMQ
jgi:hypothetical protein